MRWSLYIFFSLWLNSIFIFSVNAESPTTKNPFQSLLPPIHHEPSSSMFQEPPLPISVPPETSLPTALPLAPSDITFHDSPSNQPLFNEKGFSLLGIIEFEANKYVLIQQKQAEIILHEGAMHQNLKILQILQDHIIIRLEGEQFEIFCCE